MKKLFLLLFVLSLLIVNVNAIEYNIQEKELTVEETKRFILSNANFEPFVSFEVFYLYSYPKKITCIDGDTIHVSHGFFHNFLKDMITLNKATFPFRIAGIDAFDSKSRKMIEKQKKATGLSEKEIKKRAQQAKEYCEEYFIKQNKCKEFDIHGIDIYGRSIVNPCLGEYQRNLVKKGLATIYKENDLYKIIFDEDY